MAIKGEKEYRLKNINLIIRPGDPLYVEIFKRSKAKNMSPTQWLRWLANRHIILTEDSKK